MSRYNASARARLRQRRGDPRTSQVSTPSRRARRPGLAGPLPGVPEPARSGAGRPTDRRGRGRAGSRLSRPGFARRARCRPAGVAGSVAACRFGDRFPAMRPAARGWTDRGHRWWVAGVAGGARHGGECGRPLRQRAGRVQQPPRRGARLGGVVDGGPGRGRRAGRSRAVRNGEVRARRSDAGQTVHRGSARPRPGWCASRRGRRRRRRWARDKAEAVERRGRQGLRPSRQAECGRNRQVLRPHDGQPVVGPGRADRPAGRRTRPGGGSASWRHPDRQREVPAQAGDLADRGISGAQARPGRQPGQQDRRLTGGEDVKADHRGVLQRGQPSRSRSPGRGRPRCPAAASGPVTGWWRIQHQQDPPARWSRRRRPGLQARRDVRQGPPRRSAAGWPAHHRADRRRPGVWACSGRKNCPSGKASASRAPRAPRRWSPIPAIPSIV